MDVRSIGKGLSKVATLQECNVPWPGGPNSLAARRLNLHRQLCWRARERALQSSSSCPTAARGVPSSPHAVRQTPAPLTLASPEDAAQSSLSKASTIPAVCPEDPIGPFRQDLGGLQQHRHILPDGAQLEVLEIAPVGTTPRQSQPPLLFVHGASHAAWCWEENFLPWFAQHGHHCYAVSFRGSGNSDDQCKDCSDTYLQSHTDLSHLIESLPEPPVLVAHSMGGFFAQRYLIELAAKQPVPPVSGVVMMASACLTACVPDMQWWQAQESGMQGLKVIWWMLTSSLLKNRSADKSMLFSADVPDSDFGRYHNKLRQGRSSVSASFKELRGYMPQVEAMQDAVKQLPVPIAVAIAGKDALILPYQVEATAEYFGVEPMLLPGVAHDLMLDTRWESAAEALDEWLKNMPAR